jgi:hypothetical protein
MQKIKNIIKITSQIKELYSPHLMSINPAVKLSNLRATHASLLSLLSGSSFNQTSAGTKLEVVQDLNRRCEVASICAVKKMVLLFIPIKFKNIFLLKFIKKKILSRSIK